jgi:hypothetical protein
VHTGVVYTGSDVQPGEATDPTARIHIDGCSTTAGSPVPGVNAIAVPIFDHTGQRQCALTLIGPEREVSIDPAGPMAQRAIERGRDLSAWLEYVEQRASASMAEETATRALRRAARDAGEKTSFTAVDPWVSMKIRWPAPAGAAGRGGP